MTRRRRYGELRPAERPAELVEVAKAGDRYQHWRFRLHDAIRAAYREGQSLRAIAEASGVYSHEQVRRIVAAVASAAARTYSSRP